MQKPFFTIVIPTLNEEKRLPELLTSLSDQVFRQFEVIIVDATSQDKTVEVARSFAKSVPRLKWVVSDKKNLSYQRNLGAKKAQSPFLVFLDADVKVSGTYLKTAFDYISKSNATVVTSMVKGDIETAVYKTLVYIANKVMQLLTLTPKQFACGAYLIVSRDKFFLIGGFREDLLMSEDHDLTIRLRKIGCRVKILPHEMVTFSLRRLKNEGILRVAYKYTYATLYSIFAGPMTKKVFSYETGGQAHVYDK
jgi:glycosyltransferase involved in cell wall biosynthesis